MKTLALKNIKLCSLRIPTAWVMVYNNFLELEPGDNIKIDGVYENNPWNLFTQNMLQISHQNYPFIIDLGWYPEASPEGYYETVLIKDEDWDKPYRKMKTRDRQKVIDEIEEWMAELTLFQGVISP